MRRVHRCTEPKAFLTRAESFLRAAEVENALMLGICGSARCDDSCYLATVEEDQVVVAGGHRSGPAHRGPVEPYWRRSPPTEDVAKGCLATSISDFLPLPGLLASFSRLGYDVAEMVLADEDGWDRYEAAKWLTMRRWLEANPDDELAEVVRADLTSEPERYAAYTREYLGWGVFALMPR